MSDHFNVLVVAWMFLLMIGAWVLANALIDLGAKRVRRWLSERWSESHAGFGRTVDGTREPR